MPNELPWFPLYTSDILTAITAWPTERVGAYFLALCYQWEHGSVPTSDAKELGLLLHTTPAGARKLWPQIAAKFVLNEHGHARNERLEVIRAEVRVKMAAASDHGRKGSAARWGKQSPGNARALPEQSAGNSNQIQIQKKKKKDIARDKPAPDPRVSALVRLFNALHVEKFGTPAAIKGAKDGGIIKALLQQREEGDIASLMRAFFVSPDPFIRQAGYTVGVFQSQIGKLLAQSGPRPADPVPFEETEMHQQMYRNNAKYRADYDAKSALAKAAS